MILNKLVMVCACLVSFSFVDRASAQCYGIVYPNGGTYGRRYSNLADAQYDAQYLCRTGQPVYGIGNYCTGQWVQTNICPKGGTTGGGGSSGSTGGSGGTSQNCTGQ